MVYGPLFGLFGMLRSSARALLIAVAVMPLLSDCSSLSKPEAQELAPVLNEDARNRIPDQYIVAFTPGTDREAFAAAQKTVKRLGGTIRHTIRSEPM